MAANTLKAIMLVMCSPLVYLSHVRLAPTQVMLRQLLQLLMRLLQVFARGLCDSGYRDEAAAVYCNLLRSGCDKAQQADLLRRCLQVIPAFAQHVRMCAELSMLRQGYCIWTTRGVLALLAAR